MVASLPILRASGSVAFRINLLLGIVEFELFPVQQRRATGMSIIESNLQVVLESGLASKFVCCWYVRLCDR